MRLAERVATEAERTLPQSLSSLLRRTQGHLPLEPERRRVLVQMEAPEQARSLQ